MDHLHRLGGRLAHIHGGQVSLRRDGNGNGNGNWDGNGDMALA